MTFYTTRTKAINKLSISGKIFDWLCFLNGISAYCPRKKGNKNEAIYFLYKDIKTIQKDKLLKNIQQINIWKSYSSSFRLLSHCSKDSIKSREGVRYFDIRAIK